MYNKSLLTIPPHYKKVKIPLHVLDDNEKKYELPKLPDITKVNAVTSVNGLSTSRLSPTSAIPVKVVVVNQKKVNESISYYSKPITPIKLVVANSASNPAPSSTNFFLNSDPSAIPVAGIDNVGNSCYINASLQILFLVAEIAKSIDRNLDQVWILLAKKEKVTKDIIYPLIQKFISSKKNSFINGRMEDAAEFIFYFIMDFCSKSVHISNLFQFYWTEKVSCQNCSSFKEDQVSGLGLNLYFRESEKTTSLNTMINNWFLLYYQRACSYCCRGENEVQFKSSIQISSICCLTIDYSPYLLLSLRDLGIVQKWKQLGKFVNL